MFFFPSVDRPVLWFGTLDSVAFLVSNRNNTEAPVIRVRIEFR